MKFFVNMCQKFLEHTKKNVFRPEKIYSCETAIFIYKNYNYLLVQTIHKKSSCIV